MPLTCLLPPCTASITTLNPNPRLLSIFNKTQPPRNYFLHSHDSVSSQFSCRASGSSSSSITDFDLYDLLGVESGSDQFRIKNAYRTLQKRCHPDIAGPTGHDMAIILNEAYSVLSDPTSRLAYDKEQAKLAELRGYTGKPIYSVWYGSDAEHRAVFVDELKCVGCLKCAWLADKTFAIETAYGRARVVAQWADPEAKIQDAIAACPVDCISVVERSDLASLEFLMSKQPRGKVRVGASDSVGARVSNIFAEAKKFQQRYADATRKVTGHRSKETDSESEARMSAVQAIRSISNWLYWRPLATKSYPLVRPLRIAQESSDPDLKKLRAAAAARNQATNSRSVRPGQNSAHTSEYWNPPTQALPSPIKNNDPVGPYRSETAPAKRIKEASNAEHVAPVNKRRKGVLWRAPILMGTVAAVMVRYSAGDGPGEVKEHIGGSIALSIVNSPWLQVALAGIIWYFMGVAMAELVEASQRDKEY